MGRQLHEVWLPPVGIYGIKVAGVITPVAKYRAHVLQILDVEPGHWASSLIDRAVQKAKKDWEVRQIQRVDVIR